MPAYRVTFPGGAGYRLAGIVDRPESLNESTPVVVFSHCFTCNKDLKAIVRIARGLAAEGITVLRYDMTGLGGSEGDFSHTDFDTNVADLRAAIRFAEIELGPVRGLIGHSFGGAASMAVAGHDLPSNLRGLVSLAAPSDTQHLAVLLDRMNPGIQRDGAGEVSIGGRTWTIRREMLANFRDVDLSATIPRIRVPVLILHSPDDATVAFDHALRIMTLRAATGSSLITLAGADHLLSKAADIRYVTAAVAAFLLRHANSE